MAYTETTLGDIRLIALTPGAVTVASPWTSDEILIVRGGTNKVAAGYFSLDLTFTGAARTLAATLLVSNGSTFVAFEGAVPVFTGKSAGHYHASFTLPICRAFKIVLTATTDTCTVTECIVAMA